MQVPNGVPLVRHDTLPIASPCTAHLTCTAPPPLLPGTPPHRLLRRCHGCTPPHDTQLCAVRQAARSCEAGQEGIMTARWPGQAGLLPRHDVQAQSSKGGVSAHGA